MPGFINDPNHWDDDTLFAPSKPPLERAHAPWRANAKDTSKKAGQDALGRAGSQRRAIYNEVFLAGSQGLTVDELRQRLNMPPTSVSARVTGLQQDGWLVDSGQRRPTRYGSDAIVWVAA